MTVAHLRVSVVSGTRRIDLAVPPALPVAELVPGLAHRLGVVSYDGLRLCTVTGSALDDSTGLAAQDVPDGAVLSLAPPPAPPPVQDDAAEVLVETAPPGDPMPWASATAAALALSLATGVAAVAGNARSAAMVALLLFAVALMLGRVHSWLGVIAATASCGHAAVAGGLLAAQLRPDAGVVWAAVGGGALAPASLAMVALPSRRLRMLPVLVVGAAAAVVGAVLSIRSVALPVLACVLLVLAVLLASGVPWLAIGRISRPRGRVDPQALAEEARTARELLTGLTTGLGIVQLAAVPVAARHGPSGAALAGCASAFVLLRARHHSARSERLPGLVAGNVGLLLTAGVVLWVHQPWRAVGAAILAGVGGVLLLAQGRLTADGRGARTSGALTRLVLDVAETVCLVALVPLLLLAAEVVS